SIECEGQPNVEGAIAGLAMLGYRHRGNLGISGREAFYNPEGMRKHNLYVCYAGGLGLRNHLAFRDYLRAHPEACQAYAELKRSLAPLSAEKYENYWFGKTEFVLSILAKCGLPEPLRDQIESENR
ncbi:MAG: GrpB family protein, partial [Planctomycetes bacterium]|nr:GrpB family protein [Planctomycetota bacterium]